MGDACVITDPFGVAETFVTGMLPIEDLGGLMRITLYSERVATDGVPEKVIVTRLVMSRECFDSCLNLSLDAGDATPAGKTMRLVQVN